MYQIKSEIWKVSPFNFALIFHNLHIHTGLCDEFGQIIVIQDYGGDPDTDSDSFSRYAHSFFGYYFGGLECVGHSFAYVAHFGIFERCLDSNSESCRYAIGALLT
jgi:hypothetical protein